MYLWLRFVSLCFLCHLIHSTSALIEARSGYKNIRHAILQPQFRASSLNRDDPREPLQPVYNPQLKTDLDDDDDDDEILPYGLQDSGDMTNSVGEKIVLVQPAHSSVEPIAAAKVGEKVQPAQLPSKLTQQSQQQQSQAQDTIFVVRVHKQYGSMLLDNYAKQLRGIAAVWCIYDNTRKSDQKTIDKFRALETRNNNFHFVIVNDAKIRTLFPNAKWQWKDDHRHVTPSIGYYMHTPSIMVLFHERFGKPEQPPLPEYVWIVEGDAFFTGNVRDFVQHYKPETADFIGKYQSRSLAWINRWQHWPQKTFDPSSLRPSGKVDIISKAEHVERYSIKLIMHMRGMMEQNKLLYGEIFASTICGALDWCRMTNLPVGKNNGVGDKTQFCFSCQVPQNKLETELMRGCGSESSTTDKSDNCPQRVSIWVHAVKWIREDGAVQNLLKIK